ILLTSNHPNSVTDPFVIGASIPRKVNFMATVQMFRFAPLKWLLLRCGVIPVNRVQDNPRGMRSVMDTFEAVYRVLERGEAVALFPEGITHDDPQLKEVKTGAARMALELEHRHGGKLGLVIVPVGLTFSAKELYRSDALANFGEPIRVADFLVIYDSQRKDCLRKLSQEIEMRIQALILHIPNLDQARVIAAVKRLYLERLRLGHRSVGVPLGSQAEELALTQRIGAAVQKIYQESPAVAEGFCHRLARYEKLLRKLSVADDELAAFEQRGAWMGKHLWLACLAVVFLPIALYGWVFRLVPALVVAWAVKRFANPQLRKAQISTASMVAGIVAFSFFYALYIAAVHWLFGWPVSLWFGLSLPVTGLIAHYYLQAGRNLMRSVRTALVLVRAPFAAKRVIAMRQGLIAEIEAAHQTILTPQKAA
ncbi:MAG TPA: lysophospholipid acyltransferase family protein, partial [Verrucomicrobiae bacterium]|nr:lysophospholipid acyltransferase family protein [Verrucomicrobiae bacterium]